MTQPTISDTVALVTEKFAGMKYGSLPYTEHLFMVAMEVAKINSDGDYILVALLHDIIEDTDVTADDLLAMGYSYDVVDAVSRVTKKADLEYFVYVNDIIASRVPLAVAVKYADATINYRATSGEIEGVEPKESLSKRYKKVLTLIEESGLLAKAAQ